MKKLSVMLLLAAMGALLIAPPSHAVVGDVVEKRWDTQKWVGLGGFQFLKVGQGARAVAMGDAFAAVSDDINAVFWNPAGLTGVRGTAWTANYTKWLLDSYLFSGAVAFNTRTVKGGVIGASVVAFRPGPFEETTILQPQGTGQTVSAGDLSIGVVYALKLTDKFSFASRVSWINQTLYTYKVNAISIDVGTLFYTGFKSLRLAMSLKNFGPDKQVRNNKFFMPMDYHVGLAAELYGKKDGPAYLTVSGESIYATDYDLRGHVGAELWLKNIFALRGGYKINYDTDSFSAGVGLKYRVAGERVLTLDVSYSDMGKYLNTPLRVTLGGSF